MTDHLAARLDEVLGESRRRGFLGPGEIGVHRRHALAFEVAAGSEPGRALDLGSGGGVPGLVLASLAWPATRWSLLDGQQRRVAFLHDAVDRLGLSDRVEVLGERAEIVGRSPDHRGTYDLVVARSFGPPAVTAECAAPLLRPGGLLVVSEPPGEAAPARWPSEGVAALGLGPARPVVLPEVPAHFVTLMLEVEVPERYPRRVGVPAKRPLFAPGDL